jgi:hypothetical protein
MPLNSYHPNTNMRLLKEYEDEFKFFDEKVKL